MDGACKSGEDWVGAVVAGSSSGLCASGAGACLGRLVGVAAAALPEQARSAPAAGCTRLAEWQRRASPLDKPGGEQYPCSCDSVCVTGNKTDGGKYQ